MCITAGNLSSTSLGDVASTTEAFCFVTPCERCRHVGDCCVLGCRLVALHVGATRTGSIHSLTAFLSGWLRLPPRCRQTARVFAGPVAPGPGSLTAQPGSSQTRHRGSHMRSGGSRTLFWCTALVGETSAHRFTDKLSLRFSRECGQRQDSSWTEPWLRRALPQELCRRLRLPVMSSAKHSAGQSSLVTPKWSHQLYVVFS